MDLLVHLNIHISGLSFLTISEQGLVWRGQWIVRLATGGRKVVAETTLCVWSMTKGRVWRNTVPFPSLSRICARGFRAPYSSPESLLRRYALRDWSFW